LEIPLRMHCPDLVPVLVVLKRRPYVLASAANEENGLRNVSQGRHRGHFSNSLPFPSRQCAVVIESKRRLQHCTPFSCTVLWRAGAVRIDLSANAAEQMSQYLDNHAMLSSSCLPQDATLDTALSLCSALTSSSSCSPFCARSGSSTSSAI